MDPWTVAENDLRRSRHIRDLVLEPHSARSCAPGLVVPPVLVRFWDDVTGPPEDVFDCLDSWRQASDDDDYELLLFDDVSARSFVARHYGPVVADAYDLCPHPAMRSDLFRLCFLLERGGLYIDADDVLVGQLPQGLLGDDRVWLQPLCYDTVADSMVDRTVFGCGDAPDSCIFYVNNAPIISPPGHPLIELALERAVNLLNLRQATLGRWDVQSTTGPGILTAALVAYSVEAAATGRPLDIEFLDWDAIAVSRWPLGYRFDARNWRRWDGTGRIHAAPAPPQNECHS